MKHGLHAWNRLYTIVCYFGYKFKVMTAFLIFQDKTVFPQRNITEEFVKFSLATMVVCS